MSFIKEIDASLKKYSDKNCIADQDGLRIITYEQFDELSGKVACKLKSIGIQKNDTVIICMGRCHEFIAAEYGIMRLGAVAIPIIPSYPESRISYIKNDSDAKIFITEEFFEDIDNYSFSPKDSKIDFFDADTSSGEENDVRRMILYTSGSTGNPKGVVFRDVALFDGVERGITDLLLSINPLVCAATATFSFAVINFEFYRNFYLGGFVHILSEEVRKDIKRIEDYYEKHQISYGFIPPRMIKSFKKKDKALKVILTGSERVINTYSDEFTIINIYGQTETVINFCEFVIDKPYDNTPVGKPHKGVTVKIVDDNGNEVPAGEEGNIIAIGKFSYEYNNLPEQTQKTFKKLEGGLVRVNTGDRGKVLPDGNLLFVNRNDWMLKVHGQRVEPGEIEAIMNQTDGVTSSIVKAFEKEDGTMLLCGFYTESKAVDKNSIKENLEKKLPHYMIPGTFVKMDSFPVNPNGKIDRKSIQMPDLSTLKKSYEKPKNETEEKLCQAMEKVLGMEKIGRNDNFLELGGNSINAVTLCAECELTDLAPSMVMIGQTPSGIAKLIKEDSFCKKPELKVLGEVKSEYPLSLAQRYQNDVCRTLGTNIDVIDMTYFFNLDEEVDQERLKKAVEDVVNEHPVYKSHLDIENNKLTTDVSEFSVSETDVDEEKFSDYRQSLYKKVRDLRKDPLFDARLLHISDGSTFLYICICHLVYDGQSLQNFLNCISAKYNGEKEEKEEASIFDLIEYEKKLKEDTKLIDSAMKVFEENYKTVPTVSLFDKEKKYATGYSAPILQNVSQDEIDEFLRKNSISILTLLEGAMELTVEKMFGVNDFCYMNVYNGRTNALLNNSHGVFAKSVFLRSSLDKKESLQEFFKNIEKQYQKLVYYDVVNTFDMVDKYPAIKSGITFNYRNVLVMALKLGDKLYQTEFLRELFEVNKPFTDLDFMVNKMPSGYGYNAVFSSCKAPIDFAKDFTLEFDETLKNILKG